jgi:hypothetical protein
MGFELEGKTNPAGTMYLGLIDMLIDLFKQKVSDVQVVFISYKLNDRGEIVMEGGKDVVELRPIAITGLSSEIRDELKRQYDTTGHLISLLVFWRDGSMPPPGIGTFRFGPPRSNQGLQNCNPAEKQALSDYLNRITKASST